MAHDDSDLYLNYLNAIASRGGGGSRAVMWNENGEIADLNSFIDLAGAGLTRLTSAEDINGLGQILAYGETPAGNRQAVVLTPVPELDIWIFLLGGMMLMFHRLKHSIARVLGPLSNTLKTC